MTKHVLQFHCPCCQKPLELDTRTGKVRAMATRDSGLDALIDAQRSETERLGGLFDRAKSQHGKDQERLDDLFRKARDDAKDDRDRPNSPFDLE